MLSFTEYCESMVATDKQNKYSWFYIHKVFLDKFTSEELSQVHVQSLDTCDVARIWWPRERYLETLKREAATDSSSVVAVFKAQIAKLKKELIVSISDMTKVTQISEQINELTKQIEAIELSPIRQEEVRLPEVKS